MATSKSTPNPDSPLHTSKSHVKRGPNRATYDRQSIHQIIDDSLLCHVAQSIDGQAFVTPTCHWREGDYLYWHGHSKARNVASKEPVCINICQLDGLVLARSAFHHSINYRSVTLFGTPEMVTDAAEKARHLKLFVDKVSPNRWDALRPVTDNEVKATGIVRIAITEASCKVRAEPPSDDKNDYTWPVWAGVLPLEKQWGKPQQDPLQTDDYSLPEVPTLR